MYFPPNTGQINFKVHMKKETSKKSYIPWKKNNEGLNRCVRYQILKPITKPHS